VWGCGRSPNFSCLIALVVAAAECKHTLLLSKRIPLAIKLLGLLQIAGFSSNFNIPVCSAAVTVVLAQSNVPV
jgi:hypothetical protein